MNRMTALTGIEKLHGNLPQLQNLIKRDPCMYKDDFCTQLAHFESELKIFQMQPQKASAHFGNLVTFLSHCMSCYTEQMREANFTGRLIDLITEHYSSLKPKLRGKLVQSLVLIRNRGLLDSIKLFGLLFKLFDCEDKTLRANIFGYIISDIRNNCLKGSNNKEVKRVKVFVYSQLHEGSAKVAVKTMAVMIELYRRRVWNDERTVNVLADACFSDTPKVAGAAMRFFLGIEQQMEQIEGDEEAAERKLFESELPNAKKRQHSRMTRKRKRQMERATKNVKKKRQKMQGDKTPQVLFKAIEMINDAQGFAERLFKGLKKARACTFETKLMMIDLISRLIGFHKLLILNFYSHIQRYLNSPTQQSVTRILAALLQACHEGLPAEELLTVVRTIADAFVVDRRPADVMCIGINSIRGIIARVPHILEESQMKSLVGDLVQFKKNREKGVVVAARGLINEVRVLYPALLKAKDRGRDHKKDARPLLFGEEKVESGNINDEDGEDGLDVDSDEEDDEDGFDAGFVTPGDLEGLRKRRRAAKEERLAIVRAGREQKVREKKGGSTNLEKKRKKNFSMVQQSAEVRQKMKVSLKQQQSRMNKKLKKMRMDKKCSNKKINKRRK